MGLDPAVKMLGPQNFEIFNSSKYWNFPGIFLEF